MEGKQEVSSQALGALIGVAVGFALGLVIAWIYLMQREGRSEPVPSDVAEEERLTLEPGPAAAEAQSTDELEPEPEPHPDDLTRVEGIGPKISSVLAEAGIVTFEQLAGSDPETLSGILRQAGLPFADPTTWPEQAALAADDASDQLDALQEQLSGGRRVG